MNNFSILIGLGATVGLAWVAWRSEHVEGVSIQQVQFRLNAGLIALVGALLGGRISYVGVNWSYYQTNLGEAVQVWMGGITWAGALAGGLLAMIVFAWINHRSFGLLADGLLPLALTMVVTTWLGCWQAGCAYGPEVQGWWGLPSRDEAGEVAMRLPLQVFAALVSLIFFFLTDWFRQRLHRHGQAASLVFLGISSELLAVSLLRVDPRPVWRGLHLDTWAGLFYLSVALVVCVLLFIPRSMSAPSDLQPGVLENEQTVQ